MVFIKGLIFLWAMLYSPVSNPDKMGELNPCTRGNFGMGEVWDCKHTILHCLAVFGDSKTALRLFGTSL